MAKKRVLFFLLPPQLLLLVACSRLLPMSRYATLFLTPVVIWGERGWGVKKVCTQQEDTGNGGKRKCAETQKHGKGKRAKV